MMIKVIKAKACDGFILELTFSDGSSRRFDATPYLNFPVFNRLSDPEYFKDVKVAFGTVQWRDEEDISPETLYLESVPIEDVVNV